MPTSRGMCFEIARGACSPEPSPAPSRDVEERGQMSSVLGKDGDRSKCSGRPSSRPSARTSSLNNSRKRLRRPSCACHGWGIQTSMHAVGRAGAFAGQPGCVVRSQEYDRRGDLFRPAEPAAEWCRRDKALGRLAADDADALLAENRQISDPRPPTRGFAQDRIKRGKLRQLTRDDHFVAQPVQRLGEASTGSMGVGCAPPTCRLLHLASSGARRPGARSSRQCRSAACSSHGRVRGASPP